MPQSQSAPASPSEVAPSDVPLEDFTKHRGQWLAFSGDGRRLIASCKTLKELDAQVRAAGENPEDVLLHQVPDGEAILSGSELS